jgi:ribosome assembly protein YihI (activator of Der GTPase)
VVHNLYGVLYTQIQHLIEEDPEFDALLDRIVATFTRSMSSEMSAKQSLERMEYLMTALIEEIKVNYVQRLSAEDIEALMDQTRALRQVTQIN